VTRAEGLLQDKTAVITGGAGGLGQAIAARFSSEGARVVVSDLDLDRAEEVADKLPGEAFAVQADASSETDLRRLVDDVVDRWSSVDVFVNNAGITRDATLKNLNLEDWDAVHNVHLRGAFIATKLVAEQMRTQQGGVIINMSSLSGKVGNFGQANYSAAKAGLVALTKVTAKELAKYGVRANALQPGLISTPMTADLPERALQSKLAEIPMGRPGTADEVAKVALFLASDLSSYMTGAVLEVGGGRYM
jgi:3-oxoacyl-[acyl-carrier protein] reductase